MAGVEVGTSIARSPEQVFDFVADMRNEHRWHTDLMTPVIKRMIRKANLRFIANLKRVLEEG